jgi:hypothetical protein
MTGTEERPFTPDHYQAAWALFKAYELGDEALVTAIYDEWDDFDLQRGLTLVAAVLRKQLRDHAKQLGCGCGSDAWVEDRVLNAKQQLETTSHMLSTCMPRWSRARRPFA